MSYEPREHRLTSTEKYEDSILTVNNSWDMEVGKIISEGKGDVSLPLDSPSQPSPIRVV